MKNFFLALVILTSLISCNNEPVKCDRTVEINKVKEIFKNEMLKKKRELKRQFGIDEEYLNYFYDNNVKFNLIRTKAVNKELKSCECIANMELSLNTEVIDYIMLKADKNEINYTKDELIKLINLEVIVKYSAQETSDKEIVVESIIPDALGELLTTSYSLDNFYKESKIKRYNSAKEDKRIELYFKNSNQVEIKIISNDHLEKFDLEYTNGKLINNNLPDELKDKYYILDGENLKVYLSEGEGYDTYTRY
jgi:hypothetical protein